LHNSTFANAGYAHRYWVNGALFSGEARLNVPGAGTDSSNNPGNWGTVLAGTLGAGGAGYFVLDVTNPALFSASNASKLVLIDATDTSDPAKGGSSPIRSDDLSYIGYQLSPPVMEMYTSNQSAQIVQINTQQRQAEWAVIMGNGYNSASGQPVLLIQSLTQDNNGHLSLHTVPVPCHGVDIGDCKKAGNGLSAPRPIDVDGNGTVDIVYAGDLMGNLWKFDISSPDHGQWKVTNGTSGAPAPLFTAVGPTGQRQPITTAPAVVPRASRSALEPGFMVVLGTGKNLTETDMTDTHLNSVYGLYDDQKITKDANRIVLGSSNNVPIFATCLSGTGQNRYSGCLRAHGHGAISQGSTQKIGTDVTVTANRSVPIDSQSIGDPNAKGWYYDIPDIANGNAAKVLDNPVVMPNNTLMFYSRNVLMNTIATGPSSSTETCGATTTTGAVLTTVNFFDLFTGNPASNAINIGNITYNKPGANDTNANRIQISTVPNFIANGSSLACVGADCMITLNSSSSSKGVHAGWRIGR
jgi:type IV pilus assembly protein PilY1